MKHPSPTLAAPYYLDGVGLLRCHFCLERKDAPHTARCAVRVYLAVNPTKTTDDVAPGAAIDTPVDVQHPLLSPKGPSMKNDRVNTIPSNGDVPTSTTVAPIPMTAAEAMRQAVQALGDVTVDDQLAPQHLRELATHYEAVTRAQAAYDQKADEAKTAKKSLESATAFLLEQVRAFTHAKALPLFDQKAEAAAVDKMKAGEPVGAQA